MRPNSWRLLIIAAPLLISRLAYADGYFPDFPFYPSPLDQREAILAAPPVNGFAFEVQKFAETPSDKFIPVEGEEFVDRTFLAKDELARQKFERENLNSAQISSLESACAATTGDTAYAAGATLPPIVRAYTAGAVAFRNNDFQNATNRFAEAQAAEGPPTYKVWATYMLGRTYTKLGDADKARGFFLATRDMVQKGAPDPLGLAVASFGEEARTYLDQAGGVLNEKNFKPDQPNRLQKFHEAVRLYALQARANSRNGLDSLHILGKDIKNVPTDYTLLMQDELDRRLFLAYARGYSGGIEARKEFLTSLLPLFPDPDKDIADQLPGIIMFAIAVFFLFRPKANAYFVSLPEL